jgi:hypothetical protein
MTEQTRTPRTVAPIYSELYAEWAADKHGFDVAKVWDALWQSERDLTEAMAALRSCVNWEDCERPTGIHKSVWDNARAILAKHPDN